MRKRNKYAPEFKGKVALAAVKGQKTMAELCQEYSVHVNIIQKWKMQLLQNISAVFGPSTNKGSSEQDISHLHAKIGELLVERDFLKKALRK
jgi:transposase-like protein